MMLFDDFVPDPMEQRPAPRPRRGGLLARTEPEEIALPKPVSGDLIRVVTPLTAKTRGVLLTIRGHGDSGTMVLKTDTMRPAQCYRAVLPVRPQWHTVNLLWSDFHPVGGVLRRTPRAEAIRSYAIMSQTDDEERELLVSRVRFY